MQQQKENFGVQKWVVIVAVLLFAVKILAYYITHSVAILTDALESTVNVVSGFIGLYSLYVASKPRDTDHPYGHGKAEFISAAVEGTLIIIAGLFIIYESINSFIHPHELKQLDNGMILVAIAGALNYLMGYIAIRRGTKNKSLALVASGRHLQSDTYSTIGILVGVALIYFTGISIIDSIVAMVFSFIIMFTGYKILRASLAGIMDETDLELLQQMVLKLNQDRPANWIDLHNLRVIKYGSVLHVDCHLTVPWYLNVHEAHREVDALHLRIRQEFGDSIELFVHTDGCLDFSCAICAKMDCVARKHPFEKRIEWTVENIMTNIKHQLPEGTGALNKTA
ncbi:cation diffusion facilitator family transporter [Flavihumibacter stibioxidans]|uniref:Cation diffusion facilitator family transporter n=1 Tax=Flavihumibacter stibioxidans TaxID=1834163 RepID=A0ABR7M694_9BACT|nr:cation diffusion facilitator family transporter [Flavihumibacter stibioxidans]MBC6490487.1 cation diffusion facilitator family transporter [Flavihumibacter stibioxidans]